MYIITIDGTISFSCHVLEYCLRLPIAVEDGEVIYVTNTKRF